MIGQEPSIQSKSIVSFCAILIFVLVFLAGEVSESAAQSCGRWVGRFPSQRTQHSLAFDSTRGVLVMYGGRDGADVLADTWEWNGSYWDRRVIDGGPPPLQKHAMAFDAARSVVVLNGGSDGTSISREAWEWNGTSWTLVDSGGGIHPGSCLGSNMAYDAARGLIMHFGGYCNTVPADFWSWDGGRWSEVTDSGPGGPESGLNGTLVYDSNRQVVVQHGGFPPGLSYECETWDWNGTNWSLAADCSAGPKNRSGHATAFDSKRNRVVLFSGNKATGGPDVGPDPDTWEFDGTDWERKSSGGPPEERSGHAMAFDSVRGETVLFGGSNGAQSFGNTWAWNGSAWQKKATSGIRPSARFEHDIAYNSTRNVAVLFGGADETLATNKETWEWNDGVWKKTSDSGPVSARYLHSMAYDPVRDAVVLFGGYNAGLALSGTFEWDGASWLFRSNSGPSRRAAAAMVYDSARQVMVLFGGANEALLRNNETWEWNGTEWSQRAIGADAPAARYYHAMAYDKQRKVTVLFGGDVGTGGTAVPDRETWEWDGNAWTRRSMTGPTARFLHSMAYDELRGKIVLNGGGTWGNPQSDTWEWDGSSWTEVAGPAPQARGGHKMFYDNARKEIIFYGGLFKDGSVNKELWEFALDDADKDGTPDCLDGCPNDADKTAAGVCGCGTADTDSDGDSVLNCNDQCANDANKTAPGVCGCGTADTDSDGDTSADCNDQCPNDPNKTTPGTCSCGTADVDENENGIIDCLVTAECSDMLSRLNVLLRRVRIPKNKKQNKQQRKIKSEIKALLKDFNTLIADSGGQVLTKEPIDLAKEAGKLSKAARKALKVKNTKFKQNKRKALRLAKRISSQLVS